MQQLLRAQWGGAGRKGGSNDALTSAAILWLSASTLSGSMHPLVYELPGPRTLSRMYCLGNGREGVRRETDKARLTDYGMISLSVH